MAETKLLKGNRYANYYLRRQFILAPREISEFDSWKRYEIAGQVLYVQQDLENYEFSRHDTKLIILGSLYDYRETGLTTHELAEPLLGKGSIDEIIHSISPYTGRFVVFYQDKHHSLYVFHDPSGSRKAYYHFSDSGLYMASRPERIARLCGIEQSTDPDLLEWMSSSSYILRDRVNLIDHTPFEGIRQLHCNKYLDVSKKKVVRFWPTIRKKQISLQEGIERAVPMLRGYVESGNNRHELMMSVTSGNDSRLLLAASRGVSERMTYYVLRLPHMKEGHPDINIPPQIFSEIDLPFEVITYPELVDDQDFKEVYFANNEIASEKNLARIYHVYFKRFADKVHLSTNFSDIVRNFFETYRKDISAKILAELWQYNDLKYIVERYAEWLDDYRTHIEPFRYPVLEMFNWEERNLNWYPFFIQDKDMVQEEYGPYISRSLMEIMLAVPAKYRDKNTNIYYRAMIKHMWPELSKFPYNPDLKHKIKYVTKKTGIYWPSRRILKDW